MSLIDSIANDFDKFDGVESVTYQRRNLDGSSSTVSNVKALKRATVGNLVPISPNGQTPVDVARWHIKVASLPGGQPKRGDRIVSITYGTWEVLNANTETLGTRYAATCKKVQ